jgi:hypothetical protein
MTLQNPETIIVTGATGGAGVATANTNSTNVINGTIERIYLEYTDSPPAGTTDVTIATIVTPTVPILTITNAATDGWFYPMAQAQNQAGADITNQGKPIVINDRVKVTIAQANNDDGVTATIVYS